MQLFTQLKRVHRRGTRLSWVKSCMGDPFVQLKNRVKMWYTVKTEFLRIYKCLKATLTFGNAYEC